MEVSRGAEELWHHERGLGRTGELRPASRRPFIPYQRFARRVRAWGVADLRHEQYPVPDRHHHWHLGPGQTGAVRSLTSERRTDSMGLWLGGTAPPTLLPLVGRAVPGRHLHVAGSNAARSRSGRGRGAEGADRAGATRAAERAPGRGCGGTGGSVRFAAGRNQCGRRAAADAPCPQGQDPGRDCFAQHGLRHGRRGLRRAVHVPEGRS